MSKYNRKGYRNRVLKDPKTGKLKSFPVKQGSVLDRRYEKAMKLAKKERQAEFRAYKIGLKEAKKAIPLAERAKINISKFNGGLS